MPITRDFEMASAAPDEALAEAVRNPMSSPISQIAALSELQYRQRLRGEAAAMQDVPRETVADRALKPIGYADGGEVKASNDVDLFKVLGGAIPMIVENFTDFNNLGLGLVGKLFNESKKKENPIGVQAPTVQAPSVGPAPAFEKGGQVLDYSYIDQTAQRYGIDPSMFRSLLKVESGGRQVDKQGRIITSSAGALGAAQLMPGTAKELGVNPYDWKQNVEGGARYLSQMHDRFGNWNDALRAYNAGPGNASKSRTISTDYANKVLRGAYGSSGQPLDQRMATIDQGIGQAAIQNQRVLEALDRFERSRAQSRAEGRREQDWLNKMMPQQRANEIFASLGGQRFAEVPGEDEQMLGQMQEQMQNRKKQYGQMMAGGGFKDGGIVQQFDNGGPVRTGAADYTLSPAPLENYWVRDRFGNIIYNPRGLNVNGPYDPMYGTATVLGQPDMPPSSTPMTGMQALQALGSAMYGALPNRHTPGPNDPSMAFSDPTPKGREIPALQALGSAMYGALPNRYIPGLNDPSMAFSDPTPKGREIPALSRLEAFQSTDGQSSDWFSPENPFSPTGSAATRPAAPAPSRGPVKERVASGVPALLDPNYGKSYLQQTYENASRAADWAARYGDRVLAKRNPYESGIGQGLYEIGRAEDYLGNLVARGLSNIGAATAGGLGYLFENATPGAWDSPSVDRKVPVQKDEQRRPAPAPATAKAPPKAAPAQAPASRPAPATAPVTAVAPPVAPPAGGIPAATGTALAPMADGSMEEYVRRLMGDTSARDERMRRQEEEAKSMARLNAGLAIAAGKSPYFAQNLAGAMPVIQQYQRDRMMSDAQAADFERQYMDALIGARGVDIASAARTQQAQIEAQARLSVAEAEARGKIAELQARNQLTLPVAIDLLKEAYLKVDPNTGVRTPLPAGVTNVEDFLTQRAAELVRDAQQRQSYASGQSIKVGQR